MRTKSLGIILILTVLLLMAGSGYSTHPWEGDNDNNGPFGCSAKISRDDPRIIITIPIFSDFLTLIYLNDVSKEGEHQNNSVKIGDNSYQIIFPW
jgi:hypothetical protein